MKMKVLFIAPGDALHTSRWIERVQSEGIECIFLDITSEESMIPINVERVYRLINRKTRSSSTVALKNLGFFIEIIKGTVLTVKYYAKIKKIIKLEQPDLVHLHWLFHPAALAATLLRRIPMIATPWGSDLLIPEYNKLGGRFRRIKHNYVISRVTKKAAAFCCDASHMRDQLVFFGANPKSVRIIYFGTDIELFSPYKKSNIFWEQFGLSSQGIKVLSNRVLADMYDIETFIRAAKIVADKLDDITFVIAGSGPQSNKLMTYASHHGPLDGKLAFIGRLSDQDFTKATASCDIYVSTSPTDGGIAASVAEAMSSAVPVIVTDFGDNARWLRNQSAGYIFQIGDSVELATKIFSLVDDVNLRTSMGQKGREIISTENNSKIEIAKVILLYQLVLEDYS